MAKFVDDCFRQDSYDIAPLLHDHVITQLRARIKPVTDKVFLTLAEANGRICAEDVVAGHPVPGHANAAVDGYAFAYQSLRLDALTGLKIVARTAAGHPYDRKINLGEAARIFTGAILPEGCDTVAMQEDCELCTIAGVQDTSIVHVPSDIRQGANVRNAGEDVCKGEILLKVGDVIRPQDIATLASIGHSSVACFASPRIAIISSGDEIVRSAPAGLAHGQVYDANAPMLFSLAKIMGATVTDLGVLPDRPEHIVRMLQNVSDNFDLLLTSGGASRGEEDHMACAIKTLGTCYFWHILVKPGKPLLLGQIGSTIVAGLPGNPVAAFVCFLMYAHPIIRRLSGAAWPKPRSFPLPADFDVKNRKTGRREFWRGFMSEEAGQLVVKKIIRDGSNLISGLRVADGLIDIPENLPSVRRGDIVNFIPFSQFGIRV